ncbi:tRNA (adenosine(37)-N6)-threonylcarbamoyltransferase complex transferase subunit TsaD [Candidatus Gracilibacteria bacterium]|nr:tRNA (adenosine(37)-N6)-threonylcarbamoyltransferase complex transferase subunit TsaD [Candidatus Gracilibacteria bacterium]
MKILAFETSCDDTGVAIVENGTRVLANVKHSQVEHSVWGGVVPEIAARLHAERWRTVLKECLAQLSCTIDDVDALAVTAGPGLQTSLLVGTTAASFLSLLTPKKLIPVQHIAGHIASVALERPEFQNPSVRHGGHLPLQRGAFPALTLVASGGHTEFYRIEDFAHVQKVGQTIDDASGEAFDKVAKMLKLGYPGGPLVSAQAEKGDGTAFDLPRPLLAKDSLDFSFSGVKAAIYRIVAETAPSQRQSEKFIADVCASFEQCVVDIFLKKLDRALDRFPECRAVHFVGGVSANKRLRAEIEKFCEKNNVQFYTTKKFEYSTDNAAMIGAAAYFAYQKHPDIAQVQFVDANPGLGIVREGERWRDRE